MQEVWKQGAFHRRNGLSGGYMSYSLNSSERGCVKDYTGEGTLRRILGG